MGLLGSVARAAQRLVVGDANKRQRQPEVPAMRMIVTEEPRPSHKQQVHDWINGGEQPPDRAIRMQQKIHQLHHADYMSFPEGEGTLGIHHKLKGFKNPHEINEFYNEPFLKSPVRRKR